MKKVFIISGYKNYRPFGDSLSMILEESFCGLDYDYYHTYNIDNKIYSGYDDIIIFVMPPEKYIDECGNKNTGNGKRIFWSIEPFIYKNDDTKKEKKIENRLCVLENIVNGNTIDNIWFYNKNQQEFFNTDSSKFVPIGISKCMEAKTKIIKLPKNKKRILFLGEPTGDRKKFFNSIEKKTNKKWFKFAIYTRRMFDGSEKNISEISKFRVGIDYSCNKNIEYTRWHRLAVYSANKIVILSDSNLSKYGIKNRDHYLLFNSEDNFINIAKDISLDFNRQETITKNMYNKMYKDFSMKNILKEAL